MITMPPWKFERRAKARFLSSVRSRLGYRIVRPLVLALGRRRPAPRGRDDIATESSNTNGANLPVGGRRPPGSRERRNERSSSGVVGGRAAIDWVRMRASTTVELA